MRQVCVSRTSPQRFSPWGRIAQATGSIEGRITDETKASLPGVTVEVASPNLPEAKVVDDRRARAGSGLTLLPPGTYAVRFTLPGFTTQEQANVAVGAGRVVTLQVQMRSAYKEEVSVTGTLIPRPTLEAMSPVTTMDVEELTYQGNTRLEDLLTTLPQVFSAQNSTVSNGASGTATVNLRNLGSVRTLVLIDGKRMPAGDTLRHRARPQLHPGRAREAGRHPHRRGLVRVRRRRRRRRRQLRPRQGLRGHQGAASRAAASSTTTTTTSSQGINAARGFSFPSGQAWDGGQFDAYVAHRRQVRRRQGPCVRLPRLPHDSAALKKDRRDYTNCSVLGLGATGPACGGSSTSPTGRFCHRRRRRLHGGPGDREHVHAVGTSKYAFNYAPVQLHAAPRPEVRRAAASSTTSGTSTLEGYGSVMLMDDQTDAQIAPSGDFGNTPDDQLRQPDAERRPVPEDLRRRRVRADTTSRACRSIAATSRAAAGWTSSATSRSVSSAVSRARSARAGTTTSTASTPRPASRRRTSTTSTPCTSRTP